MSLVEDEREESREVGEEKVRFVADCGCECGESEAAVLDIGVAEDCGEHVGHDGTEVFVVGAVCCGEDVAEGEDGDTADRGGLVAEKTLLFVRK